MFKKVSQLLKVLVHLLAPPPDHLILPFDTHLKTNDAQTNTKTSTLPDEDDMTVWQLGFVNLSRAIDEHREIDTSFLKLDLNLKVRDYRAAQASGNGGSTAIIEAFPNHEAEEEVSTASEVQKQIEGRDHDKPGSRGEEQVRSTAVKDRGDDEVVIEVQIGRGEVSEIVLDLSAMEARRVKVRVKRSE
ncbi:hypothetical protein L486_00404 [Kwoniella mangroviensis CBS 10435]|uniref:Uncharacterized protein n=1 Tax=Kwoniella mangroviensis CBS 10435 TaxID=1331196 RepID=A0A1B9IZC6_9TREE|nr:hypothetical protein L486_00404 [Kwoniella mangroviensis CBS 10435]